VRTAQRTACCIVQRFNDMHTFNSAAEVRVEASQRFFVSKLQNRNLRAESTIDQHGGNVQWFCFHACLLAPSALHLCCMRHFGDNAQKKWPAAKAPSLRLSVACRKCVQVQRGSLTVSDGCGAPWLAVRCCSRRCCCDTSPVAPLPLTLCDRHSAMANMRNGACSIDASSCCAVVSQAQSNRAAALTHR
jgi:hypothetical protein